MWFDENYVNGMAVKNFSRGFSNDEETKLHTLLNEQGIGLTFFEVRSIENSFFQNFCIYINEHLTELFITGIIAPAAYDAIKIVICLIVNRISACLHKTDKNEPLSSLRLKIGKADVIAPIPNNLNDNQFSMYMNMLQKALAEANEPKLKKITKYECFIAECSEDFEQIVVKTINEYGHEQIEKNKSRKVK